MSNPFPSTHRRRETAWDQVLFSIVQVQGPDILKQILAAKASTETAPTALGPWETFQKVRPIFTDPSGLAVPLGKALAVQMRARATAFIDGVRKLRGPERGLVLEKAAVDTLCGAGFVGGMLFGLQLPQIDFKMSAKGQQKDSLVFHAASLMVTEVALEWVEEVLRRTLLTPELSSREARFLRATSRVLKSMKRGVERGWSTRQVLGIWVRFWKNPIVKQHVVATDLVSLRTVQDLIQRFRS